MRILDLYFETDTGARIRLTPNGDFFNVHLYKEGHYIYNSFVKIDDEEIPDLQKIWQCILHNARFTDWGKEQIEKQNLKSDLEKNESTRNIEANENP